MNVPANAQTRAQLRPVVSALAFWLVTLGLVSIIHRHTVGMESEDVANAAVPKLDAIPCQLGHWEGVDVPMDPKVLAAARTDAHINRRYVNRNSGETLDLYVAFTKSPVNMLGHRPDVCYPANGWVAEGMERMQVSETDGVLLDCLLHKFWRNDMDGERLIVANYYVLPEEVTTDWNTFAGLQWRRRAASTDSAVFVAQVQVVGAALFPSRVPATLESVKQFTARAAPEIARVLAPIRAMPAKGTPRAVRQ